MSTVKIHGKLFLEIHSTSNHVIYLVNLGQTALKIS